MHKNFQKEFVYFVCVLKMAGSAVRFTENASLSYIWRKYGSA